MDDTNNVTLDEFIETAKQNKYVFTDHEKVWENINNMYLLNEPMAAGIASRYLLSSFALVYTSHLNTIVTARIDNMTGNIPKQIDNDAVMHWISDTCLPAFQHLIEICPSFELDHVVKLGHIIDLTLLELNVDRQLTNVEIYEIFYNFLMRIQFLY